MLATSKAIGRPGAALLAVLLLAGCAGGGGKPTGQAAGKGGDDAAKLTSSTALPAIGGVTPLAPPLQVRLVYAPAPPRTLTLRTSWGPVEALSKGTPPLVRRVEAKVRVEKIPRGLQLIIDRQPTELSRAEDSMRGQDGGRLRAAVAPDGRLFEIVTKFDGLTSDLVKRRRDRLLDDLIYRGRPAPFRRLLNPAGPGDVAGRQQDWDERAARAEAEIALAPLLALLPGVPPTAVADGDQVPLLRRDFGTLFRRHPDLWTEVRGRVAGLTHRNGRRLLVVAAEETPAVGPAPGWTLTTRGRGLLDLDTGFYVEIRLDHVLTAPAAADAEPAKFIIREHLELK